MKPLEYRFSVSEPALASSQLPQAPPESLASLFAHLPGFAYRAEPGAERRLTYVAGACQRLTGLTAAQLTSRGEVSYAALTHPQDQQRVQSGLSRALLLRQPYVLRYRLRPSAGRECWVEDRGAGVWSAAGELVRLEGFVAACAELPEARERPEPTPEGSGRVSRLRAEQALADSERKFAVAFESSPFALAISDMETGHYLDVNRSFERVFGWSRSEAVGRTSLELGLWRKPSDRERWLSTLKAQTAPEPVELELYNRERQPIVGRFRGEIVEVSGRVCLLGTFEDETESRRAASALRKSEERFSKAFRASVQSLIISELATGRIMEANAGFERIFGYRRSEVIGRTSAELGLWPDPEVRREIVEALEEHGSLSPREVRFPNKAGRQITVLIGFETIEIDGVDCVLASAVDVTAERSAAERQARLEAQLQRAQKLDALGQLVGGVAHDFNNLLTGIMGNTELAQGHLEPGSAVYAHLLQVRKASDRARDLVRRILTFSRNQSPERKAVQLGPVVQEAVNLLRATLPATIEIERDFADGLPTVLADSTQIHQVVMNLGINAAHASGGRPGQLRVKLDEVDLPKDGGADHAQLAPGRYARLTVSDTGCGMDAATLARLFEPFFTTKGPGEGTGLGLSVVHGIVEAHEGVITVTSRVGHGSTFVILLPEHVEPLLPDEGQQAELPRGQGERILVVDDEPSVGEVERGMLERLGYRVTLCSDPREAWRAFETGPFDLVLSDITMPHLTGVNLARRMLAQKPAQPVLLASGFGGAWTTEGVRAMGVRGLLAKPMTLANLAQAVHAALRGDLEDVDAS